ncbi:MAG: DapH/DapD/GlmU-related protein [Ruminococcus callidus]
MSLPCTPISRRRNLKQRPDGSYYDLEYGKPITVGNNCWFGSNVTVCGGVTIGDGCVIGAGGVVTRDIPANSLAAGSPCRVIRQITEQDSVKHHPGCSEPHQRRNVSRETFPKSPSQRKCPAGQRSCPPFLKREKP